MSHQGQQGTVFITNGPTQTVQMKLLDFAQQNNLEVSFHPINSNSLNPHKPESYGRQMFVELKSLQEVEAFILFYESQIAPK